MTALCNEEDLARIAAEAAAKAASKSAEEGLASGITVSTATLTGSSDPTDTITSSASVRYVDSRPLVSFGMLITSSRPVRKAGKKVKEDFSKRCVCKPENKLLVTKCYNCMINHDIPEAETIILQAQMCDPNYGVREPIYRNTGKPDPQATATKISKDTRTGGSVSEDTGMKSSDWKFSNSGGTLLEEA